MQKESELFLLHLEDDFILHLKDLNYYLDYRV